MANKVASAMIEMIVGIILVVIGLGMAGALNGTITNITTGANATANGAAATSMWGLVPLMLGVILLMIPLAGVFRAFKQGKG